MKDLANTLNRASVDFEIGKLQEIRMQLKSLTRQPCQHIFSEQTIHNDYAFHVGGRKELQFNIGREEWGGVHMIRHGVAFSLEPSQTLPTIDPLLPKIARFNDYVQSRPEEFPGFQMWHYRSGARSNNSPVGPIPDGLLAPHIFIMMGRAVAADRVDIHSILADFDRLIPLYIFVESGEHHTVVSPPHPFKPGCPRFAESSSFTLPPRTVDVALRHSKLQHVLYRLICQEVGDQNVAVEHSLEYGVRVDLAVKGSPFTFYELKIAPTVQSCVRAAIGQLLEYAYWPSNDRANELIVVGEAEVDQASQAYLQLLRDRFNLPVWYRRLDPNRGVLHDRS